MSAEKVFFPKNVTGPILREQELRKIRSLDEQIKAADELNQISDQLSQIILYYFDPGIDIDTPKRLLEMAGLFAEHEAAKATIEETLKGTDYEKSFFKVDGWHLPDELRDILSIRREAAKFIKFRAIVEDKTLDIEKKRKKLETFANSHKELVGNLKSFDIPDNAKIDFFDNIENILLGYNALK